MSTLEDLGRWSQWSRGNREVENLCCGLNRLHQKKHQNEAVRHPLPRLDDLTSGVTR